MQRLLRPIGRAAGRSVAPSISLILILATNAKPLSADPQPARVVLQGGEVLGPIVPGVFDGDLRDLEKAPRPRPGDPIKEVPRRIRPPRETPEGHEPQIDPLLGIQQARGGDRNVEPPILNFAGQGFSNVNPPDTVGDVGLDHYIQAINSQGGATYVVYNKSDGSVAAGPIFMDLLGTGQCAAGLGDPVVLYDQLADRWFISEFSQAGDRLCIYISQTSNPVSGGWFVYQFTAPGFPDYPKYGVWPDAYYASTNEASPAAYAFDRSQMLIGAPATAQRFTAPDLAAFGFQALLPADADGETAPPLGAPNPFIRHRDDEAHNAPGTPGQDFLEIWEFHVDWATPANSTFTGPTNIPIAEIDSELCGFVSFECFPQPGSSVVLDPLREVVMHRLQYRNFGTHETLVGNLVTDVDGTDHGGIRWFELRDVGSGWTLHQEGTYAPDEHHRWMGSAAMDGVGNLAIAYSISSDTMSPSIRYTAHFAADPLGTMRNEQTVITGSAANASFRWGDYSSLNVDPVDDRTFWLTNMYSPASQWATRIATFELCDPPGPPAIGTATATAANVIELTWGNGSPPSDTFNVQRAFGTCASPTSPFVEIAGAVAGSPFQDTSVSGGSTYAYRVTGVLDGCESAPSACVEATATGACTLPPDFDGLDEASNSHGSTCAVDLSWDPATALCGGGITYNVYRSTTSGFSPGLVNQIATGVTTTTHQDFGGIDNGTGYFYVVRAVDTGNASEDGNTVERGVTPTGPFAPAGFVDTFEGTQSGGGFDIAGWSHAALSGAQDRVWSTAQSQSPTHSWFSDSLPSVSNRVLISPEFGVTSSSTLSFWHRFDFEGTIAECFDAGTLEISIDGGSTWTVVPDAAFTAGGFNGTANPGFSNPIGGKRAWCSGTPGPMIQVTANLSAFDGQVVHLRWHEGNDTIIADTGWFVDSVTLGNVALPSVCSSEPPAPLDFFTVTPCRLVDTRNPPGPLGGPILAANADRTFDLDGSCGVPSGASALSVNLTAVSAAAAGTFVVYPGDLVSPPNTSTLNFQAGLTRANNAIVKLDAEGEIKLLNSSAGTTHCIIDVNGYFLESP
jgi:hypothetical protein